MRKQKIKDIKNRLRYKEIEMAKIESNLVSKLKEKNFLVKLEMNKNFHSRVKIVNRCILSNRRSSIHHKFKISRIMLRNSVINGLINGLKKASF